MRYPLLVFDWDGTLIDSAPAIVACIQAACRDLGLTVPDEARASHVIGLGLKDALSYAIPACPRTTTAGWWSRTAGTFSRATPGSRSFREPKRCLQASKLAAHSRHRHRKEPRGPRAGAG